MDNELIKQKIHANVEHRKTLWAVEVVLVGGLATIALNMESVITSVLFVLGFLAFILFAFVIKDLNKELAYLFKKMEKK